MDKYLLVIDIQPSFNLEPYYSKVINFINENRQNYKSIIATRFLNTENSVFVKRLNFRKAMTKEKIPFKYDLLIDKFTCGVDKEICKVFFKNKMIDVVGCDTDACVLETCFNLFEEDIDFNILTDYCYSTGGMDYHEAGIKVMERNFGKDILI